MLEDEPEPVELVSVDVEPVEPVLEPLAPMVDVVLPVLPVVLEGLVLDIELEGVAVDEFVLEEPVLGLVVL